MKARTPRAALTRRQFVAVVAAGSAALLAQPAASLAAVAPAAKRAPAAHPAAAGRVLPAATRKEFERQRAATLDTLKTIRGHAMPPGTEPASVFHVRRPAKKGA